MRTLLLVVAALAGCTGSCAGTPAAPPAPPVQPAPPSYEVHEWGLVRGTADDRVLVSGPHADPPPVPVAKPVLYFHRTGGGPLRVDVEARLPNGRIVERWPLGTEARAAWAGVEIRAGSCRGARYPGLGEPPCAGLTDGCEAATLASVETDDSDCLSWNGAEWNHLFYRGEVTGAPALPLRLEALPGGSLRVVSTGTDPIPGVLVRVQRGHGAAAVPDGALPVPPPPPGDSVVLGPPTAPLTEGAAALAHSLRTAGLTDAEVAAFGRAWDATLFGADATAEARPTGAAPPWAITPPPPPPSRALLYVLPVRAADALAALSFSPPPAAIRRAIVVYVEEPPAP